MVFTHVVKFVVEAARVAHGFSVLVASPERRRRGLAVGAASARPSRRRLQRQWAQSARYHTRHSINNLCSTTACTQL